MQIEKSDNVQNIDQNALSRQLAVYGHQAQGKLMMMRVYIHGMSGLAIEVVKNLVLAGPKQVTIYDQNKVEIQDVGRNFYCKEEDVGNKTRAQASLQELKNLNSNVNISIATNDDIQFISKNYECVVILDHYNKAYLIELNKACHQKGVAFILAGNLGLYGYTYVDFGQKHRVIDPIGEECKVIQIAAITRDEKGLVCLHEEKKHNLFDGDTVMFKEVKGMQQINNQSYKIQVVSPTSFTIGDTSKFSPYVNGGMAVEQKVPIDMQFYPLQKSLRYPYPPDSKQMPIASWQKFGVPEQLHIILNGVYTYYEKNKRLPRNLNVEDSNQLVQIVKKYKEKQMQIQGQDFKVQNIDEKLIQNIALYSSAQISPLCSFWGGIITQEIIKLTGKHTPLRQWLHHQFFQVLPEGQVQRTLTHSRYYDYVLLFGDQFIKRCSNSSLFIVGAGALGCQFIKMFTLMGLGTSNQNKPSSITVTDDDNIEISNLNRQFLFRKQHVGKNKSQVACHVGKRINSKVNINSLKLRVAAENQDVFNDQFWNNLQFIVNAVDNVKARQYIDQQCVWYEKPLFQSGTLGTKCHSQIIIPHHTQSYSDIIDPPEQSIPLCTLKNFPYQIQHTIQWARDFFQGAFSQPSSELVKFYKQHTVFLNQLSKQHRQNPSVLKQKLSTIKMLFEGNQNKNYAYCVYLATKSFHDLFYSGISQLLNALPADHIVEQTGKPFWSGLKKVPKAIQIDLKDPLHIETIQAGANIYATMFNMPMNQNKEQVAQLAAQVKLQPFVPKNIKVVTDQKATEQAPVDFDENDEKQVEELLQVLSNLKTDEKNIPQLVQFQKDDPKNFHIEFMGGVSNLRARNYGIQQADNFKIKLIAGKIIPAIATTTAMIVGAVGIEIIKYILKKKPEEHKNVTINLAVPLWVFNDPLPPIVNEDKEFDIIMAGPIKVIPGKFTKWEKINVKGPMSLEQLKNYMENTYKFKVSMITFGSATLYSSYGQSGKRLAMNVNQAIEDIFKKPQPKWKQFLPIGVSGEDAKGIDCILPDIRYQI